MAKYTLHIVVGLLFCFATVLHAQPQSENRDGFYKDIFMDSGVQLVARK